MSFIVELHGARLIANNSFVPTSDRIPGDYVTADGSLVSRVPQITLGLVLSLHPTVVSLPLFGPACPSRFSMGETFGIEIGNRLILELVEDGRIRLLQRFGAEPCYDAAIMTILYRRTPPLSLSPSLPPFGLPHYTREGIVDHRSFDTFTIDPATSVDFDDALSVDIASRRVYVHIVDIMSAIHTVDLPRVRTMGSTLYLANEHTEHLLSEPLVDTLSLVEGEERSTITVAVTLSETGLVTAYDIYRSVIIVKRRYSYDEVASALSLCDGDEYLPQLQFLANLDKMRSSKISYKIDMPSPRITMNRHGDPAEFRLESTTDAAHGLVATAMILCNMTVSYHLNDLGIKLPNRFHSGLHGIPTADRGDPTDVAATFRLLKQFKPAEYSVDNNGHFGLGLTQYVHFTSPMRRYADIVTHMILAGADFSPAALEAEVTSINQRAVFVKSLQRLYMRMKTLRFLAAHPDAKDVVITSVNAAGVQWFMPSMLLNGFCHVSMLRPSQRWTFDSINARLIGLSLPSLPSLSSLSFILAGDRMTGTVAKSTPYDVSLTLTLNA